MTITAGQDPFPNMTPAPSAPPENAYAVTKSDTAELPIYASELYIGVSGDVAVIMVNDRTVPPTLAPAVTLKSVAVGVLRGRVAQVLATGTTATNIIARY